MKVSKFSVRGLWASSPSLSQSSSRMCFLLMGKRCIHPVAPKKGDVKGFQNQPLSTIRDLLESQTKTLYNISENFSMQNHIPLDPYINSNVTLIQSHQAITLNQYLPDIGLQILSFVCNA